MAAGRSAMMSGSKGSGVRTEPNLDRGVLLAALRADWGLEVERLEFVPYGLDSWSYVATRRDGKRAFVKLALEGVSTTVAGSELPLLVALADRGVPVPRPIGRPDGRLGARVGPFDVQVLEYVAGRNLEDESDWPDELYGNLARIVGAVHASTAAIEHLVERLETYELPFIGELVATLEAIGASDDGDALPSPDEATVRALRDLVRPRIPELGRALGRLEAFRDEAARTDSERVLCHTDIWGSNLILDADGALHLLDWNGARLGPPEQDLFMFAGTSFFPGERLDWFLDRYEAAFRPLRPQAAALGFYLYRRNLEDLANFIGSLAAGRTEAMAPGSMLRIVARLLVETTELEAQVARTGAILAGRARGGGGG